MTISTKLIHPTLRPEMQSLDSDADSSSSSRFESPPIDGNHLHPLSATHLSMHNLNNAKSSSSVEWIVVRIEVTDTGYGIRPKDLVESRLFCTSVKSHHFYSVMNLVFASRLQSDRAGKTTRWAPRSRTKQFFDHHLRWKGNRTRTCAGETDCQAERWSARGQIRGWEWFHLLGRAS